MPILCSIEPQVDAVAPPPALGQTRSFGTTNSEIPRVPAGASGSRASTRCTMSSVRSCSPAVMKIFGARDAVAAVAVGLARGCGSGPGRCRRGPRSGTSSRSTRRAASARHVARRSARPRPCARQRGRGAGGEQRVGGEGQVRRAGHLLEAPRRRRAGRPEPPCSGAGSPARPSRPRRSAGIRLPEAGGRGTASVLDGSPRGRPRGSAARAPLANAAASASTASTVVERGVVVAAAAPRPGPSIVEHVLAAGSEVVQWGAVALHRVSSAAAFRSSSMWAMRCSVGCGG